jgi:hypothetical protein
VLNSREKRTGLLNWHNPIKNKHPIHGQIDAKIELQDHGILEVDFVQPSHLRAPATTEVFKNVFESIKDMKSNDPNKGRMMIRIAARENDFLTQQVSDIVAVHRHDSPRSKKNVMLDMFASIADRENVPKLLRENYTPVEIAEIKHELGRLFVFDPRWPTGRYKLDLAHKPDRQLIMRLVEIGANQKSFRKQHGLADTSQHGNFDPWRNMEIKAGGRMVKWNGNISTLPPSGTMSFDFTSTMMHHAAHGWVPVSDSDFVATFVSDDIFFPELQQANHEVLGSRLITVAQLWRVLERFPAREQLDRRIWVAHALWDRVVDVENFWLVLCNIDHMTSYVGAIDALTDPNKPEFDDPSGLYEHNRGRLELANRLGWLNCWDPLEAEGFFSFNLIHEDERVACDVLVKLAVVEPGMIN